MKNQKLKIFFTICAINMVHFLHAQMIYVPDAAFRTYLNSHGYASCLTGDSIDASCPAVMNAVALNIIGNYGIQSIDGVQAFSNLQSLTIIQNPITNLSTLPSSLIFLDCSGNSLNALPPLPTTLKSLNCYGNVLTNFSTLPDSLTYLNCSGNQLTSILSLPDSLIYFYCSYNQLTSLPVLLIQLFIWIARITAICRVCQRCLHHSVL